MKGQNYITGSEQRYRTPGNSDFSDTEELGFILENVNEMIGRISAEGIIEYASLSFLKYMGYEPHSLIGRNIMDLFHPNDKEVFFCDLRMCMKHLNHCERDLLMKDTKGKYVWVEIVLCPIINQKERREKQAAICIRKVFLQKVLEELDVQLKMKEQSPVRNMGNGFAYFSVNMDKQGNPCDITLMECNSPFRSIIGLTQKNIIGEKASQLLDMTDEFSRNMFSEALNAAFTGEPSHLEACTDKNQAYISNSVYRLREGRIIFLCKDITKFKKKEELERIIISYSTRFINTPSEKIDDEINHTLCEIGKLYEAEYSWVFLFNENRDGFCCTHEWAAADVKLSYRDRTADFKEFKWLTDKIQNNDIVEINDMDSIPAEALKEKEHFKKLGCRSLILAPLTYENRVLGFMGLNTVHYAKRWIPEQIDLLKIICIIFASLIMKSKKDQALHKEIAVLVKLKGALKDSMSKYRKLTQSIQDAIILLDSNGRIVNWNNAARRIFGYSYSEVSGKKFYKLIASPESLDQSERLFSKFILSTSKRTSDSNAEITAIRKGGSRFIAEISISTLRIKGELHVVGVVRDITERKEAQKKLMDAMETAEAANKAKSQFLANMSHEIRTPLNGIIGFLDLLNKTPLDELQDDYVKEMCIAANSLMGQINDLLDFSKLEVDRLKLEHIEFCPRKAIEEIAALFSPRAYSKGIEIHAMIDNNIPVSVRGDPGRLKQVIGNLVSNAVKFTKKGEVVISAKLASQTEEKANILFKVTDTGIGISGEDINKLFVPFSQIDASTTRRFGGTGLGLTISQRIIHMMSGEITVESVRGKGSAFQFEIGFEKGRYEKKETDLPEAGLKGWEILVADESGTNREIVRTYLESAGCRVTEAENGMKAMEILKREALNDTRIKAVLLDYNLSGESASELTKRIKAQKEMKKTKLILMLPLAAALDKEAAERAGISEFLLKPVYKSDLLRSIWKTSEAAGTKQKGGTENRKDKDKDIETKKDARILLAEDNITNQKLAASILKNAGYSCNLATNGFEAVKALEEKQYDIILMDCQMPEMDGYEATRKIREMECGAGHTTIIAMTANAMKSDYQNCIMSGMDDYISKPFKTDDLLKIIEKWLEKKEPVPEEREGQNKSQTEVFGIEIAKILDDLARDQKIDRETVHEIYNEFAETLPETLRKLQDSMNKGDFAAVTLGAHTLKGASAGLRLSGFSQIAAELETQSKSEDIVLCRESMDRIILYSQAFLR